MLPTTALTAATSHLLPRCTFPVAGTSVTCAVSGGADSLALLVLAAAAGCAPTAVHVDHGLRPGSADEYAVVRDTADRLGVASRSVRVEITHGPNLEARARAARFAVLPADVLTGHTADDQAETVMINLLRGAGLDGLAGMRASVRRPLLHLRRSETHALCAALHLPVVHDPSNDDPRFVRNRVRQQVLPALNATAERDLVPVLARQAELLRDEAELLDLLAGGLDPTDARGLTAAPVALARRAVRRWLTGATGHPPDAATVQRVLDVARNEALACDVGAGRRVTRSHQQLTLHPPATGVR